MTKQLFLSGGEVARIENGNYYILSEDDFYDVLVRVSKEEFKTKIQRFKDVCFTSWCKDLKKQYLEITKDL